MTRQKSSKKTKACNIKLQACSNWLLHLDLLSILLNDLIVGRHIPARNAIPNWFEPIDETSKNAPTRGVFLAASPGLIEHSAQ